MSSRCTVCSSSCALVLQAMPPDKPTQAQAAAQAYAIFQDDYVEGVYDRLGNITAPTLIIAGQQDAVVPVDYITDLFRKCAVLQLSCGACLRPKLCMT